MNLCLMCILHGHKLHIILKFHCDSITEHFNSFRKIMELEEELKVVGNSLKSLEVSEEKVCGT